MNHRYRHRSRLRHLRIAGAALLPVMTGLLLAAPIHVEAATTVTLTASATTVSTTGAVTLTATAGSVPSGYTIDVYEQGTYFDRIFCASTTCSGQVASATPGTRTYIAYVDNDPYAQNPPTGILGRSSPVAVTWVGTDPYTLTLTASATVVQTGQSATLTAVLSPSNVPVGYQVDIYNVQTGYLLKSCYESSPCSAPTPGIEHQEEYIAYLNDDPYDDSDYPPQQIANTSNTVTVSLIPSQSCDNPTIAPINGNVETVSYRVAVQAELDQTTVCTRVTESVTGVILSGALVILSPSVTVPSEDGNATACTTTPGNAVPGAHPMVSQGVGSEEVTLDSYVNGTHAWICVSVGGIGVRVLTSAASALPTVSWEPDPDNNAGIIVRVGGLP